MKLLRINRLLAAAGVALAAGLAAAQPLAVCMAEDNAPLSYNRNGEARGLDLRLAQAVAAELQRPLKVVLFESKFESESSLAHEVNALLSSGVCELASGFPLLAGDIGPASRPTARVPDYPGAKRRPQRPWVPLGTLAPSLAYHAVAWGLLVREASRESATLAEPGDARIGVVAGTMTGSVAMLYHHGKLRSQLVYLSQNEDALEQLEAGKIDATLSSLDRYDAWRLDHPASVVRRAAYVHPSRINIGFVALAESTDVLAAADRVISRSLGGDELQRWAAAEGATWMAPSEPQVRMQIGLMDLTRE